MTTDSLIRKNKVLYLIFLLAKRKKKTIIRNVLVVNGLFIALFLFRHSSATCIDECVVHSLNPYFFFLVRFHFSPELHFLMHMFSLIRFCISFSSEMKTHSWVQVPIYSWYFLFGYSFPILHFFEFVWILYSSLVSRLNTRLNGSYTGLRCTGHIIQYTQKTD